MLVVPVTGFVACFIEVEAVTVTELFTLPLLTSSSPTLLRSSSTVYLISNVPAFRALSFIVCRVVALEMLYGEPSLAKTAVFTFPAVCVFTTSVPFVAPSVFTPSVS